MSDRPTPDAGSQLAMLVERARAQARTSGRRVMVSATERVPELDPLAVLEAADPESAAQAGLAELLGAGRMFWQQPRAEVSIAALGAAHVISPAGAERFALADAEWRALLQDALVQEADASAGVPAGPIVLGGFSFEPAGPRSDVWRGFPGTHLVVPALHVTRAATGCWLTLTTIVEPDGRATVDAGQLSRLRAIVLGAPGDASPRTPGTSLPASVAPASEATDDEWRTLVRDAVAEIHRGALDKVVLARAVHVTEPKTLDVIHVLEHLRALHRDVYVFAIWRDDAVFLGASPERLVRVRDNVVDVSSLAGSARRGDTAHEDDAFANGLLQSAKDREEHAMVRDALGTILGTLCDDVSVPDEPALLTLPHVHHLHTPLRARLRAGSSLLQLASALHPTPAVGGTPREAALRFIREREQLDRGWYAAPVGWIGRNDGELAVALRSALIRGRDATLFAGCGIVAGSDPERELAESEVKLGAMRAGLAAGQA